MEVESLHTITKKVLIIGLEKCSGNVKKKGFQGIKDYLPGILTSLILLDKDNRSIYPAKDWL